MNRHDRLTALFLEALELPERDRRGVLLKQCPDDLSLVEEVLALLEHREKAGEVLGGEALDLAAHLEEGILEEGSSLDEEELPHPEWIGPYRVLGVLGRGGMGVVYEAEQENPRRSVALKVVPTGWMSLTVRRRFARESRILGLLQHPGIAQIFEAGSVETQYGSQPYFAMELVRGIPLTRFAREEKLTRNRRLEVFARICDAMHYAHQKGVVHRDLKPSNILVDDGGNPKVLDFGIARTTHADVSATTLETDPGQFVGTLAYMSPEQCEGERHEEVGSGSDVFSLGVLLYELLLDRLPYDLQGKSLPEAVRTVREEEPVAPSAIDREMRGDLETILLKALEKRRDRRYDSAADLGLDLRRFLGDEPILARPASAVYQFRKFARRNKAFVGGAAATVCALLLGFLGMSWQAFRATEDKNRVLALSDRKRLSDLEEEAESLWPAYPENIDGFVTWLEKARELAGRRSFHEGVLAEIRQSRGAVQVEEGRETGWVFTDTETRWHHDALTELVAGLDRFVARDLALEGERGALRSVEERLRHAREVRKFTLFDCDEAWDRAIASIADSGECPRYHGLRICPQIGLVPISRDPATGLWEFAHLQTGTAPRRGERGKLSLEEESGVVLVLVPGGTFLMGAQPRRGDEAESHRDETDELGSLAQWDPFARRREGPVHRVSLDPFFLSKYELTQAQWQRISGSNGSYYGPSNYEQQWNEKGDSFSFLQPVDDVTWEEGMKFLTRVGLSLPTEAQWEYSARGGTRTVWWSGDEVASLRGVANLADRFCKESVGPPGWRYESAHFDGQAVHGPVGSYRANGFGLHDVIGNVWEWCLDYYGDYELPVRKGDGLRAIVMEAGMRGERVFRGGSFSNLARDARSAKRDYYSADSSNFDLGLRPSRSLDLQVR